MVELPEARVRPTRYEVSCLPADDINAHCFTVGVEWRGGDRWAVTRYSQCLGRDGAWSYESIPSERRDDWLAGHRFSLDEALILAKEHAPKVRVNGWTVAQALAVTGAEPA